MRRSRASDLRLLLRAVLLLAMPAGGLGAQWVEAPGRGWVSLALYRHDTRSFYASSGREQPFFAGGRAVATSLFVTAAVGVLPGLDVWLQLPLHRLRYSDAAGARLRRGVGDVRAYVRVAPGRLLGLHLPVALRGGVKVPVGDFAVDAEVIPLGDGQRDWELLVELGRSLHPRSIYAMGWVGYRWREENTGARRDFGDEIFAYSAVGGRAGALGYKVAVEGWWGRTPVVEGIPLRSARRSLVHLTPTLALPAGRGAVEGGVRVTLLGRNLPAGTALVLGYFVALRPAT